MRVTIHVLGVILVVGMGALAADAAIESLLRWLAGHETDGLAWLRILGASVAGAGAGCGWVWLVCRPRGGRTRKALERPPVRSRSS